MDGVFNQMTPTSGTGSGGSGYNGGSQSFPAVPYGPNDFTPRSSCPSSNGDIQNYNNAQQVRNCKLSGMPDIYQGSTQALVSSGPRLPLQFVFQVPITFALRSPNSSTSSSRTEWPDSGECALCFCFRRSKTILPSRTIQSDRFDAAKHMWPGDLKAIVDRLDDLPTSAGFPSAARPFIYQEVIESGPFIESTLLFFSFLFPLNLLSTRVLDFCRTASEPIKGSEYFSVGRVTEFAYGRNLAQCFNGNTALKYLVNFGEGWGMFPSGSALVFVDNHDNQRGHGGGGSILTFRQPRSYKVSHRLPISRFLSLSNNHLS